MEDILALREAVKSQKAVKYANADGSNSDTLRNATHISIDSTLHPKTEPTRWQRPNAQSGSTDWKAKPEDFFALQAVVFAYNSRALGPGDYLKEAREQLGPGAPFVSVTDRGALVEWLEGRSSVLSRLVLDGGVAASTQGAQQSQTSAEKRTYAADPKDALAVKKIKLGDWDLSNRFTVMRGTRPMNFSFVKDIVAEAIKESKESPKASQQSAEALKAQQKKARNAYPIIMISSSPTALITMYNVRRFLEEATFESPDEAKRRLAADGVTKLEDVIPVYRRKSVVRTGGSSSSQGPINAVEKPIKYFVVDSVEALGKFGSDAWDRVICVMTTGQAWQFKPYKWQDPKQLFHHVKGVHITWTNDPPNTRISDWNVSDLKIDPNRRHTDKSTVANFWMQLDDWVSSHKPWLPA